MVSGWCSRLGEGLDQISKAKLATKWWVTEMAYELGLEHYKCRRLLFYTCTRDIHIPTHGQKIEDMK